MAKKKIIQSKKTVAKKVNKAPARKVKKAPVKKTKKVPAKKAKKAPVKKIKKAPVKKTVAKKVVKVQVKKEKKTMPTGRQVPVQKIKKPVKEVKKVQMKTTPESVEKIRYSDKELQEFKDIILRKLEEAKRDFVLLTEAYTTKNENDTNDTSPTFKVLEEGSNVLSKEENSQLAARQQKFIRDLESALMRIENKTYGICRVTGKLIPKERLKIVPHATMSIEAKLSQQKKK
jgi:DnaK suppressor protein